jgi:hypothetical protein
MNARAIASQASHALQTGPHSAQTAWMGGIVATVVIPHGLKGLSRRFGREMARRSKASANAHWLDIGMGQLRQCESILREISVNSRNLTLGGNSSRLLVRLNRTRRVTNPLTFLSTLATTLDEVSQYDLIWNSDIPTELARRRAVLTEERTARADLRASSPQIVRLSRTIDLYNRSQIAESLRDHPAVAESIQGAMDTLVRQGPDANRQAISSCRASIERLSIELGNHGDWKQALRKVTTSEADQRSVIGAWNYLSGKGAHGGHDPSREEAEYGLKITLAALTYLKGDPVGS